MHESPQGSDYRYQEINKDPEEFYVKQDRIGIPQPISPLHIR